MKSYHLLIPCLWAIGLSLVGCAPTPTPRPLAQPAAQATISEVPPTLTVTATPLPTETPTPIPSSTPTQPPTRTSLPSMTPTITRTPWPADAPGLSSLAQKQGLSIGAAVQVNLLAEESLYRETFIREFNILAPEQALSMCDIWPERETWNFDAYDDLVQFAVENKLRVRHRILTADGCTPDWITQGKFSPWQASDILQEYITTLVGRYRGKVAYWDVVNNTLEKESIWATLMGPKYAEMAFEWAYAADPKAKLIYTDHSAGVMNQKSDLQYDFVRKLQYRSVHIHGVGLQMHLNAPIEKESVAENIERLNALGLEVHITELSIDKIYDAAQADEQHALIYQDALMVCLEARNCPVLMLGGFTDKYATSDQPDAAPLIFDNQYLPKPAYEALYFALQ